MKTLVAMMTAVGLLIAVGACKSKDDKFCDHLVEISKGEVSADKCKEMVTEMKKECKNWDSFADCVLAAKDEEGFEACEAKCE